MIWGVRSESGVCIQKRINSFIALGFRWFIVNEKERNVKFEKKKPICNIWYRSTFGIRPLDSIAEKLRIHGRPAPAIPPPRCVVVGASARVGDIGGRGSIPDRVTPKT